MGIYITDYTLQVCVAREFAIRRALVLYDGTIDEVVAEIIRKLCDANSDAAGGQTNKLALSILDAAVIIEASDVHLEPFEAELPVRFRIDGALRTVATPPVELHAPSV